MESVAWCCTQEPIVKKPQKKEVLVELAQGGDGLAGALRELEMRL